jgi:hypothetical protein
MSLVHVYPISEESIHNFHGATTCYCEPGIINEGWDECGLPARVFVHQRLQAMPRSKTAPVCLLWGAPGRDGMQHASVWRQLFLRGVRT